MPSDSEVREFIDKHGVRVWGVMPKDVSEPSRLGEFAVVPFGDVVAAVAAAEQRGYQEGITAVVTWANEQQPRDEGRNTG